MGKYIDRIIEVLDDNNVWQTVVLPTDGMGTTKESVIFGYIYDCNYDINVSGTLVKSATAISIDKVAEATSAYITEQNHEWRIYAVSLTAMKMQVELCIERYYSQLADSFQGRNYQTIMNAVLGVKQPEDRSFVDDIEKTPRMEYDAIIEDLQAMINEISKIETLARYISGVDDPARIRVIFFNS